MPHPTTTARGWHVLFHAAGTTYSYLETAPSAAAAFAQAWTEHDLDGGPDVEAVEIERWPAGDGPDTPDTPQAGADSGVSLGLTASQFETDPEMAKAGAPDVR